MKSYEHKFTFPTKNVWQFNPPRLCELTSNFSIFTDTFKWQSIFDKNIKNYSCNQVSGIKWFHATRCTFRYRKLSLEIRCSQVCLISRMNSNKLSFSSVSFSLSQHSYLKLVGHFWTQDQTTMRLCLYELVGSIGSPGKRIRLISVSGVRKPWQIRYVLPLNNFSHNIYEFFSPLNQPTSTWN